MSTAELINSIGVITNVIVVLYPAYKRLKSIDTHNPAQKKVYGDMTLKNSLSRLPIIILFAVNCSVVSYHIAINGFGYIAMVLIAATVLIAYFQVLFDAYSSCVLRLMGLVGDMAATIDQHETYIKELRSQVLARHIDITSKSVKNSILNQ